MTSANHIWDKKKAIPYLAGEPRLLRPANYPAGAPGRGTCVAQTISVWATAEMSLSGSEG